MKQTQNEVYQQAIAKYGEENQLFQVCEECAELIKAINKWRRNKHLVSYFTAYTDDVAEEIADVEIMIDQLIMILGISQADVLDIKQSKIRRLAERLKENNT